jgi:hypothetical protein
MKILLKLFFLKCDEKWVLLTQFVYVVVVVVDSSFTPHGA